MTETVKTVIKAVVFLLVVALAVTFVITVETDRKKERIAAATVNAATGKSVEIKGQPWDVIPFTTNNGNCYNLHHRGTYVFVLPCAE